MIDDTINDNKAIHDSYRALSQLSHGRTCMKMWYNAIKLRKGAH